MSFYENNLLVFIFVDLCIAYLYHRRNGTTTITKNIEEGEEVERNHFAAGEILLWQFKKKFLPVYLLVFGADWLQVCYLVTEGGYDINNQTRGHIFTPCIKVSNYGSLM